MTIDACCELLEKPEKIACIKLTSMTLCIYRVQLSKFVVNLCSLYVISKKRVSKSRTNETKEILTDSIKKINGALSSCRVSLLF